MNLLALDLGTTTGFCAMTNGVKIYDKVSFKANRFSGGGERYLRFQRWLHDNASTVSEVAFEEVRRHRGTDAAHVYGGLLAVLTAFCEDKEIAYTGYPVGTIKKFWTGNGSASKEMMMDRCAELGMPVDDDNIADAIAIAHLHLNLNAKTTKTPKPASKPKTKMTPVEQPKLTDLSDLW